MSRAEVFPAEGGEFILEGRLWGTHTESLWKKSETQFSWELGHKIKKIKR